MHEYLVVILETLRLGCALSFPREASSQPLFGGARAHKVGTELLPQTCFCS